jgi:antitoxin YefM
MAYLNAYIEDMRTTSFSDLRKNLATTLDSVHADHQPVVITRDSGKPSAVLMSLEDFESYEATLHLLCSPNNAARLAKSIAELSKTGGKARKLKE